MSSEKKSLFLSVAFTVTMILIRIIATEQLTYIFYIWNLFLAFIPYALAENITSRKELRRSGRILTAVWLAFFPNSFYLITDLFHFKERAGIPFWFDLIIVFSATWNGMMLGLLSLLKMESFFARRYKTKHVTIAVITILLLTAYGVYLGRYLRFNSWDFITNLPLIVKETFLRMISPADYPRTWAFTLLNAAMFIVVYFQFKNLKAIRNNAS